MASPRGEGTDQGIDTTTRSSRSALDPAARPRATRSKDPLLLLFDLRWVAGRLVSRPGGGGDEETRTPDPLLAKEMLYQLSYVPGLPDGSGGRFWTRTRDLCLIRAVL